jgi:hypothetical protein
MKSASINYIKLILADRAVSLLLLLFIVVMIAYGTYVGISLRVSDLQVAVHYTAFGETTFYRDKWYYLVSFIFFGAIMTIAHSVLTVKLFSQGRRQFALLFIWLSLLLAIIVWITTWSVLKVAFL